MFQKIFYNCFSLTLLFYPVAAQRATQISSKELKTLVGCWQGNLYYSGTIVRKPFSTTEHLVVKQLSNPNCFQFLHVYTKDPGENGVDTITVSNGGRLFNRQAVRLKRILKNKDVEFVTEEPGFDQDNNKPARIRQIYTIGRVLYSYKKTIKLQGQDDWIDREEFKYVRSSCPGQDSK